MIRTNIHFSKPMLERLRKAKKHADLSIAEIVRKAVDEFLLKRYKL